ncbi:hypothetical protein [Nonomuraea maheshkhaliensis]|uniref:hypothetical protein n=1 Tax=Nonomuraea maheshkhaliensis TaxID=419590 RepID=UPI0031F8062E
MADFDRGWQSRRSWRSLAPRIIIATPVIAAGVIFNIGSESGIAWGGFSAGLIVFLTIATTIVAYRDSRDQED